MSEPAFASNLKCGALICTKKETKVHLVSEVVPEQHKGGMDLEVNTYLLALSAVDKTALNRPYPIAEKSRQVYKYQFFALEAKQIVCFSCFATSDKFINSLFRITIDPRSKPL